METITISIIINSDRQKVWETMLNDKTYRLWTKEFNETSYYEGSWDKGSEIRFLGLDENGTSGGMFSRIKDNIKYQFISIEHIGIIQNGKIDTTSEAAKKWTPSFENYTFSVKEGGTELTVEVQIEAEHKSMFEEMWPKALQSLKKLCEQ